MLAMVFNVFSVGKFDLVAHRNGFVVFCDEIVQALCRDFLGLALAQDSKK